MARGAKSVIAAATHPVLVRTGDRPAQGDRLRGGHRDQHAADPDRPPLRQLTVLSIAPLIARAIREVFEDGSVTSLFDGQSVASWSSLHRRRGRLLAARDHGLQVRWRRLGLVG